MLFKVSYLDSLTKFTKVIYYREDLIEDQNSLSCPAEVQEGQMSLNSLIIRRIKEYRELGNIDMVSKLEDALSHIDEARPCTPE